MKPFEPIPVTHLDAFGTRRDYEALIEEHGIDRYKIVDDALRRVVTVRVDPSFEEDVPKLREALERHRPVGILIRVETGPIETKGPYR